MLGRRLRIVALAAIALFVVASFVDVDEPWFAIWVALLGAAALVPIAGRDRRDGAEGSGKREAGSVTALGGTPKREGGAQQPQAEGPPPAVRRPLPPESPVPHLR